MRIVQKRDVDSARKHLHPAKTVRFPNKNAPILCHCEERSDAAILKFEAWHPVTKHGSTKQEGSPITKNMDSLLHSTSLLFIYGSVSFRATIVRSGMANRSVKDCRVGRTRPPRNDKFGRFCRKTEQFSERTFEKRCGATPRKKRPHKTKNVRFPNKNVPILCHCEERSDAAIFKPKVWHPVAKHGSTKQEKTPITKNMDSLRRSAFFLSRFCFVPCNHSSFRDGKSFR